MDLNGSPRLKNGCHLIRIRRETNGRRPSNGLYEYTVMPLGLVNAPATFQSVINRTFRDMLDQGMLGLHGRHHHARLDTMGARQNRP